MPKTTTFTKGISCPATVCASMCFGCMKSLELHSGVKVYLGFDGHTMGTL